MLPAKEENTRQVARKKITPATVHLQYSGGFLPQEMCLAGFCRRKCMGGGQHLENSRPFVSQ